MVSWRRAGPSLGIVWIRFCSIIDRLAKLVIVDLYFISFVVPLLLAQLLLVCSSYATRFSRVFFSRTRCWTWSSESFPVKSSRMISRSLRSSFSFCSWNISAFWLSISSDCF